MEEGNTEFAHDEVADGRSANVDPYVDPMSPSSPVVVAVETDEMTDDWEVKRFAVTPRPANEFI